MTVYAGVNVFTDRMGDAVRAQFLLANPAVIVNLEDWYNLSILYGQGYRPAVHIVRHWDANARNKAPATVLDAAYRAVPPEWWREIHELNADNEIDIEAEGRQDQPTEDYGALGQWKLGLAEAWVSLQQQHPETRHVKLQWGAFTPDRMLEALPNQTIQASLQHPAYKSYGWHCYNDPNAPAPSAGIWKDYQQWIRQLGIANRTHHITEYNWDGRVSKADATFAPILNAVNGSVFQSVSWFTWYAYPGSGHSDFAIVHQDGSVQYPQVLQALKDRAGWRSIRTGSALTPLVWAVAAALGLVALKRYVED